MQLQRLVPAAGRVDRVCLTRGRLRPAHILPTQPQKSPLSLPRTISGILAWVPSKFAGLLFRMCPVPDAKKIGGYAASIFSRGTPTTAMPPGPNQKIDPQKKPPNRDSSARPRPFGRLVFGLRVALHALNKQASKI